MHIQERITMGVLAGTTMLYKYYSGEDPLDIVVPGIGYGLAAVGDHFNLNRVYEFGTDMILFGFISIPGSIVTKSINNLSSGSRTIKTVAIGAGTLVTKAMINAAHNAVNAIAYHIVARMR